MRVEKDFLGEIELPDRTLYGIHAYRASENFPHRQQFNLQWFKAIGTVKHSVYLSYQKFIKAIDNKGLQLAIPLLATEKLNAMIRAAKEIEKGEHFEHFIVPAVQGGAGTSINMNINEIISNRALQILGKKTGDYSYIDPFESANIYQSTNDVIPTSLRLAAMRLLLKLETAINDTRAKLETLEAKYRDDLRIAYTQMQAAVPSSFGNLFSSYNEALSRDWWRVSKAMERIKVVNLGGGAIGTGLAIPRFFIMEVNDTLKRISGLPITRAENALDATANADVFVEVHAILKAHAVNLEKIASDLRLLAADVGSNILSLPMKQVGSSIMPAKVNPVIPEYLVSIAHHIYSNDNLISSLSGLGTLELNAYLPSIGKALLESIELLIAANDTLSKNLLEALEVRHEKSLKNLWRNPALCTALSPFVGYHKASELAKYMQETKLDIFQANEAANIMDKNKLREILKPENLLKLGFSVYDI